MVIPASLVKKLREETDAPIMECKNALVEAEGDLEKAKEILREKGKAAAAKRAGRSTAEGIAMVKTSDCGKHVAAIVLLCETDFVAKNDEFVKLAQSISDAVLAADCPCGGPCSVCCLCEIADPLALPAGAGTVGDLITGAIAVIRENIQLAKAQRYCTDQQFAAYNHHDRKKASFVAYEGSGPIAAQAAYQVAVQVVAFPPQYLAKQDVPAEVIEKEIELETQRAIHEGKSPEVAANIAKGRVHKEYLQSQVLLEQPFYLDPKLTTGAYIQDQAQKGAGSLAIRDYRYFAVNAVDKAEEE